MPVFYRQIRSMGTMLDIVVPDLDDAVGMQMMTRLNHLLHDLEALLSNYNSESEISRLNKRAYNEEVQVSEELSEFIRLGLGFYKATNGFFDFSLGAMTSLPDKKEHFPERFHDFIQIPMEERIHINHLGIRYLDPDVCIDSGGLGKGFAMRQIEKLLNDLDIPSAFISFGGSSVLGKGKHPYGDSWKLGIQHPWNRDSSLGELSLLDSSVSISGNSANNAAKYNAGHIIDTRSGEFYRGRDVVAVTGKDHLAVEAVSTAMLASGGTMDDLFRQRFSELELFRFKTTGITD